MYHSSSPFRGISSDLAVIKDCHKIFKDGGNVGITHKNPTVMRWSLVRHITGQYVKVKIGVEDTDEQSKDREHASLPVTAIKTETRCRTRSDYLRTPTGIHVSIVIQNYLINSVDVGQEKLETFVKSTLSLK